jgi:hypothetical protein
MRALNDERDAWVEAVREQIKSDKRRNVCLDAIDHWYHSVLANHQKDRSNS